MSAVKKHANGISIASWNVSVSKGPILASKDVEDFSEHLHIPVPEMTFGKNGLRIEHENGFSITFLAYDALDQVDKKHDSLKVQYAKEWSQKKSPASYEIKEVNPFDWTYTTKYNGTIADPHHNLRVETTADKLDYDRLRREDPILFFNDQILFESELDDNGRSVLNCKVRVMSDFCFILLRMYVRVDGVIVRVVDTRFFLDYATDYILREQTLLESSIEDLSHKCGTNHAAYKDPNTVIELLETKSAVMERLYFK